MKQNKQGGGERQTQRGKGYANKVYCVGYWKRGFALPVAPNPAYAKLAENMAIVSYLTIVIRDITSVDGYVIDATEFLDWPRTLRNCCESWRSIWTIIQNQPIIHYQLVS
jgi:hypothetical protein